LILEVFITSGRMCLTDICKARQLETNDDYEVFCRPDELELKLLMTRLMPHLKCSGFRAENWINSAAVKETTAL